MLWLLLAILPIASAYIEFPHSIIFTAADTYPGFMQNFTIDEGGFYVAYAVLTTDAKTNDYFKNVFIIDNSGEYTSQNNLYSIASLTDSGCRPLYSMDLHLKQRPVITIHDRNTKGKPDNFVIYISDVSDNQCDVYRAGDCDGGQATISMGSARVGCHEITLLNTEASVAVSNFATKGKTINVFTAPADVENFATQVFSTRDIALAKSSRVLVAGPVVSVTTSESLVLSIDITINPKYDTAMSWGSSVTVTSFGYVDGDRTYSHPYPPSTVPDAIHLMTKSQGAFEVTLAGSSTTKGVALEIDAVGGVTKQYSVKFEDHFTAGGRGIDIKQLQPNSTQFFAKIVAL